MRGIEKLGHVDLRNVVPITEAAGTLAALLKRAREKREHIVLTQKGRSAGVLLDVDEYMAMRELAEEQLASRSIQEEHETAQPLANESS